MKEAEKLFLYYYGADSKDIAEEEEDLLDQYIKTDGVDHALKTAEQLTEVIDSDMKDQEIEGFMYEKLGSEFLAPEGDSRNWLIRIRDYLQSKVNQ